MIEKGKISPFQMGMLMYPTIMATAILIVPAITGKQAKSDMWISPIWASLIGFLTVYVAYQLHKLYPRQTVIQYSRQILGNVPGAILGFVYLFFYLHLNGLVLREYAEFIVGTILSFTPVGVVSLAMILVSAYAVRGGVEVMGRAAHLFIPFLTFALYMMFVLLLPDFQFKNILPVMEYGIMPSIKGAAAPQAWFSEFFLISFLLPALTEEKKGLKWGMWTVFAVMVTLVISNLVVIFLVGQNAATASVYPVMNALRYISLADFFENLDSVVMAIWVVGAFIKISVFYYAAVIATAQWLQLSDYRPVVLPLGFLTLLFSFWSLPTFVQLVEFLDKTFPFYGTLIQVVIPVLLLSIAVFRKRKGSSKGVQTG